MGHTRPAEAGLVTIQSCFIPALEWNSFKWPRAQLQNIFTTQLVLEDMAINALQDCYFGLIGKTSLWKQLSLTGGGEDWPGPGFIW